MLQVVLSCPTRCYPYVYLRISPDNTALLRTRKYGTENIRYSVIVPFLRYPVYVIQRDNS